MTTPSRAGRLQSGIGAALAGLLIGAGLLSLLWTPYDVTVLDIGARLQPPSPDHPLGTDHFGRDVLSMIMVGARTSIAVALIAVLLGAGLGVPLGLLAAAAQGRWLDDAVSRLNDVIFAFPALILAIMITAVFGASAVNAIIAIGIFNIPVFARVTRGAALALWQRDFIRAARMIGKGKGQISRQHILPNIANLLIVQATIQFSLGIIAEAGLSFVGLGAQPPAVSWGRMLFDGQTLIWVAPWAVIYPGLAIAATVLGLNLLGDGLRDRLDPRRRALAR